MGNREQMLHVAEDCYNYEGLEAASWMCRSCTNCMHCSQGICMKDLFDEVLIAID